MDEEKVNYEIVARLVSHVVAKDINVGGSILIFLPGLAEILECMKHLTQDKRLGAKDAVMLVPLHSALSSEDQQKCFASPPKGTVKVVVSTNIAETSLTIDDVTVVIDAGRMKEMMFDPRSSMNSLVTTWVAQVGLAALDDRSY